MMVEELLIFALHPTLLCSFLKWKRFEADTVLAQLWAESAAPDRSDGVGTSVTFWSFPEGPMRL